MSLEGLSHMVEFQSTIDFVYEQVLNAKQKTAIQYFDKPAALQRRCYEKGFKMYPHFPSTVVFKIFLTTKFYYIKNFIWNCL